MSSMFVVGFQCRLPEPWNYVNNICVGRKNFWNFYGAMNILTDVIQVGLMITITSQIQTSTKRKITIGSVFGARLLVNSVVVVVALQLYFLNQVPDTSNATFDYWQMTICTQILQSLAVVTACMPFLKPFLDSLESGLLRADDQYRRSTAKGSYRYNLSGSKSSARRAARREAGEFNELGVLSSNHGRARNGHGSQVESGGVDWDESNSQSSQSRIIKETRTFTVDVEFCAEMDMYGEIANTTPPCPIHPLKDPAQLPSHQLVSGHLQSMWHSPYRYGVDDACIYVLYILTYPGHCPPGHIHKGQSAAFQEMVISRTPPGTLELRPWLHSRAHKRTKKRGMLSSRPFVIDMHLHGLPIQ
ncbi:hypothetical protein CIHG_04715 [Coccidioides immitis H538.4]|uniref:Rhodopsin domain-containing protein n=2 Tax=Coccidioides immitis TaxID=5501 RepID=A0A0J8RQB0_COCIT|nr:hypothetical protein CIRG_08135 [Coccidioides immitis RMSCC 2394]KMU87270.1 hypothetical protein CIHG_04715 [Coccidioides immitis H538.4]